MTKVKLVNGTVINASEVVLENGVLKITTQERTVEELAEIFSDKNNTNLITLMTESEIEIGYKEGFTSFAGIQFTPENVKTVELFQPADVTERRISEAEGAANAANAGVLQANENIADLAVTVDALLGIETSE